VHVGGKLMFSCRCRSSGLHWTAILVHYLVLWTECPCRRAISCVSAVT